jgi:hypothetical protein
VGRKRDLERDARQRAAEVPGYALTESVEALEAAISVAEGISRCGSRRLWKPLGTGDTYRR